MKNRHLFSTLSLVAALFTFLPLSQAQLSWQKYTGNIPANAVIGGQENGDKLEVCRCAHMGGIHPGKVVANMCHIGYGGKEVFKKEYEILVNQGAEVEWVVVTNGKLPANAFIAGRENGKNMYVGKAFRAEDQSTHPGKVFQADIGLICNYSWGGKEKVETGDFFVLTSKKKPAVTKSFREYHPNLEYNYNIISKSNGGMVLDVAHASTQPGANISLYYDENYKHQQFAFVPADDGYFYIESALKEKMVVDIKDWGKADETNVQLVKRGEKGTTAQKFKLLDAGDGYTAIVSAMGDNYFLGVADRSGNVVSRNEYKGDKTLFKLRKTKEKSFYGKSIQPAAPTTSPGKPGTISFFNEGGYLARFSIFYTHNGLPQIVSTGIMPFKSPQEDFEIPAGATNISVFGEADGLFDWIEIFSKTYSAPPTVCFKTYGTIFDTEWNYNCDAWEPTFSGTVHLVNKTGKPLYASWCTDLGWSAANVTNGFILGALLENMQNANPNVVRFFAIALAADMDLSKETFDYFKKVAYTVNPNHNKAIVSTGVLETMEGVVNAIKDPIETVFGIVVENAFNALGILVDEVEQDEEYMAKNLEFNPIIQAANIFGARTLNLVVFNEDMTKYWIIPTGTDESWIIQEGKAVKAKRGSLNIEDPYGRSYPSAKVNGK